jgi:hypothetical protein
MPGLSPERLALLRRTLASRGLGLPQTAPIARRVDRTLAPLSPPQERLWFLEAFEPGTALYNDALAVDVEGPLDPARLRTALGELSARHESLRATFESTAEGARQRIASTIELPFVFEDLRSGSDPAGLAEARARADAGRPFELEHAPAWRARLARIADDRWLLSLTMHHIVSDGASCGVFFDELGALYRGSAPLELAVQFGDYAAWERGRGDEARVAADVEWWTQHLRAPLPDLNWPGTPGSATHTGELVALELEAPLVERLAGFTRAQDATSNHVLLAAWLGLLATTTGVQDVRTGLAASLRSRPELYGLIGFFVETCCLRVDLSGDPTFSDVLTRVRELALEATRHERAPFDRVARAVGHDPLIQVFFSHMKDAIRAPDLGPARTTWRFLDPGVARFDRSLVLHEGADRVHGFLEFDEGRLDRALATRLANDYVALLEAALTRPEQRLTELARSAAPTRRGRPPLPVPPRRAIGG